MIFSPSSVKLQDNKMVNRPTVVATEGMSGNLSVLPTDPYFSIKVSTAGRTESTEVVLFDGSRGYQLGYNYLMPLDVVITGITAHYQYILNDVVHNSSYFDVIQMRVASSDGSGDSGSLALTQFANPIEVFESTKGSKPRLISTIYPDAGIHEGQFQKDINTFSNPVQVTNRTALVYRQEPNIDVIMKFYQKAEIGRLK
jgi:hypothetical protein